MKYGLVLLALLACTSNSAKPKDCGVARGAVISDSGIGLLRIGLTVEQVKQRCHVVVDTIRPNYDFVEDERALLVLLGRDTVLAWVPTGTVSSIEITSRSFRTVDSLGVGTTLATLLERGNVTAATGEASTQATVPNYCAVRFILSYSGSGEDGQEYTAEDLRAWPPGVVVTGVTIGTCYKPDS